MEFIETKLIMPSCDVGLGNVAFRCHLRLICGVAGEGVHVKVLILVAECPVRRCRALQMCCNVLYG